MTPFPAAIAIFQQVYALLHPARYACTFSFSDGGLLHVKVAEVKPLPEHSAEFAPTPEQIAELECAGHAERFGAIIAHNLLRQLDEKRATEGVPVTYRERQRMAQRGMTAKQIAVEVARREAAKIVPAPKHEKKRAMGYRGSVRQRLNAGKHTRRVALEAYKATASPPRPGHSGGAC